MLEIDFRKDSTNAQVSAYLIKKEDIKLTSNMKLAGFKGEGCFFDQKEKKLYVGVRANDVLGLSDAAALAVKTLKKMPIKSAYLEFDPKVKTFPSIAAVALGAHMGFYEFNKYKSKKEESSLKELSIFAKNLDKVEVENAMRYANAAGLAVNATCDVVNEIPENFKSLDFEAAAKAIAKEDKKITVKAYDNEFLEREKMGAFLAVNQASDSPARLIHLSYTPKDAIKRVVIVGKGITYDTGGLSLKPADYMLSMKADKSGAAAALHIIAAVSALELPIELHSVLGATDNAIGPKAYRPDDVLISREGHSIEVRNTDAEGRLVLADCLSFAQDLKPDLLIDIATLTGACVAGLGEYTVGVMGNSERLKNEFLRHSKNSCELAAPLDFNPYLKELIKSKIADVSNTSSSRYGGAITAGLFLEHFIREEYKDKWLHLDIAGPAYLEKDWGAHKVGASGAGVLLCLYYLQKLSYDASSKKKGSK